MTPAAPEAAAAPWHARAFGLDLELTFPAPGLVEAGRADGGRRARVELVPAEEIDRDWPTEGVERVLEESFGPGEPARSIDAHPTAGYRLYARHFGLARLSPSGDRILCSPPDDEPWSWQRFLVGRVIPWAAVLRGLEVLHASAVTIGGGAHAFVGATGAGKTSLAIQLAARSAGFLTDDVLAIERGSGGVTAHPGAGIAAVRPAERDAMRPEVWERAGEMLGHSEKSYLQVPRDEEPAPLRAVYFLRPGDEAAIEPIENPDPRLVLASTFVLGVRTAERLRNQLDVSAAMARSVPMHWLTVAGGSERLAELVDRHAQAAARA